MKLLSLAKRFPSLPDKKEPIASTQRLAFVCQTTLFGTPKINTQAPIFHQHFLLSWDYPVDSCKKSAALSLQAALSSCILPIKKKKTIVSRKLVLGHKVF